MMLALLTSFYIATAPPVVATLTNSGSIQLSASTTNITPITIAGCNLSSNSIVGAVTGPIYSVVYPNGILLNASSTVNLYGNGFTNNGGLLTYAVNNSSSVVQSLYTQAGNTYATISSLSSVLATNTGYNFSWISYTNTALKPSTNCFVDCMMSELMALTNQPNAAANLTLHSFSGSTSNLSISINTNCWLYGVTNIETFYQAHYYAGSGWYGQYEYVPVSPWICVSANHVDSGYAFDTRAMWIKGAWYTNKAIDAITIGDMQIDLMQYTNPAWVRVLPDITPYISIYYTNTAELVCLHSDISTWIAMLDPASSINQLSSGWQYVTPAIHFGELKTNSTYNVPQYVGGDSSSPAWCILNHEAVLAGVASTFNSIDAPGMLNSTNVNAAMATLAGRNSLPTNTLTLFQITEPKIQP